MNRIKDYTNFAIWFSGLGYLALWPVTSPDFIGRAFGAALACRDSPLSSLHLLCNSAHMLQLPPGLHALGLLSMMFVATRLLMLAFKRSRRAASSPAVDVSALMARLPKAISPPPRKPPRPLVPVRPRTHFGLRGTPR